MAESRGSASSGDEETLRTVRRFLWILAVVAVVLAIWGVFSRVHGRDQIGEETANEAIPVVQTAKPTHHRRVGSAG
jgi:hypothetical protein